MQKVVYQVYEIDGTFLGSVTPDGYIYDHLGSYGAWTENLPNGRRVVNNKDGGFIGDLGKYRGKDGRQRANASADNIAGITLDADGKFWKFVGHHYKTGNVQVIGWMTPVPSDPYAVCGAAYLFTRHSGFFRNMRHIERDPLWLDVDPKYFRCSCPCGAPPLLGAAWET